MNNETNLEEELNRIFQQYVAKVADDPKLGCFNIARQLAEEFLHYTNPQKYLVMRGIKVKKNEAVINYNGGGRKVRLPQEGDVEQKSGLVANAEKRAAK